MIARRKAGSSLRRRLYWVFEDGSDGLVSRTVRAVLISLILLSTATSVSGSIPEIFQRFGWLLRWFDIGVGILFTVEYALRLWVAPEHPPWRRLPPWQARRQWMFSRAAILDFLAVMPFYLAVFEGISLHSFVVLRLLRFLKLVRYSAGLASLADAVRQERHALTGCAVILFGLVLMTASAMYSAEGMIQPEKFGTIPKAMYWSVITLTTVGYGDATPITAIGKLISAFTAVGGLVMLALPAGIIASAFSLEVHRREFVVSWGMISSVPLFADLDASELSAIMGRMRSRSFEVGEEIARRNAPVEYMYFIVSGRVSATIGSHSGELSDGDFFGEIGILAKTRWSSTVRALTRCKLMMLKTEDLEHLMHTLPHMARSIRSAASEKSALLKSLPDDELDGPA